MFKNKALRFVKIDLDLGSSWNPFSQTLVQANIIEIWMDALTLDQRCTVGLENFMWQLVEVSAFMIP